MNENFLNDNKLDNNYLIEDLLINDEAALLHLQNFNNSQQSLGFNENNLDITNYPQPNYLNPNFSNNLILSFTSNWISPASFIDSPASSSNASTPLSYGISSNIFSPVSGQEDLRNNTFSPITPLDNLRTNAILNPNLSNNVYQYLSKSQPNFNSFSDNIFHDNFIMNNLNSNINIAQMDNMKTLNNYQLNFNNSIPQIPQTNSINPINDPEAAVNDPEAAINDPESTINDPESAINDPESVINNNSFQMAYSPTQVMRTYQNTEDIIANSNDLNTSLNPTPNTFNNTPFNSTPNTFNNASFNSNSNTFYNTPFDSTSPSISNNNMNYRSSNLTGSFTMCQAPIPSNSIYTADQFYPMSFQYRKNILPNASKLHITDENQKPPTKKKTIVQLMREHPKIWDLANKFKIKKGAYKCTHCDLSFLTQADFAKHLDEFGIERPHKCPEATCPYRFIGLPRRADLRRHAESHGYKLPNANNTESLQELEQKDIQIALSHATIKKTKVNICPICKNTLGRKDSLTRHINLCHKNQNSRYNKKIRKELEKKKEEEKKIELLKKYSKCNVMSIPSSFTRSSISDQSTSTDFSDNNAK
ncbi:uncharacterized protein ASCRUDRAFT_76541 [Ascoidea rubescens DSM 1968]|uniref:C2H2-type domain-containing protein n=1 Tax=Ascoidea rubescens DSM 1968 TaxID=1344418 RepID=A0A1D2VE78_9ASCO|nr:hypothetical protein ASCRUDRAFT_76541 [Ascoidea rubescens DSM 1968]ODV60008.1 hypothetical protein ASCRUDRAFT_76541 [Ascoidea rubescens DSM 1968]